jgi:hypothetical protein
MTDTALDSEVTEKPPTTDDGSNPSTQDNPSASKDEGASPAPDASKESNPDPAPNGWDSLVEAASRGDEKRKEKLSRFTDLGGVFDAWENANRALGDSKRVRIPDANATEEDKQAWNRLMAIPDSPDKYKVELQMPEGAALSEEEQGLLAEVTKEWHSQGGLLAHPQVIQAMQQAYVNQREAAAGLSLAKSEQMHAETQAALDKEWGAEKGRNLGFAKVLMERYADPEAPLKDLFGLELAEGGKLGDYLPFVRMMAKIGREFGDDPVFAEASSRGENGLDVMKAEKDQIMQLWVKGDYKAYDAAKGRLDELNQAISRAEQRR